MRPSSLRESLYPANDLRYGDNVQTWSVVAEARPEDVAGYLVSACAATLEGGEGELDGLAKGVSWSAVYELVAKAQHDLEVYRPDNNAASKRFADYRARLQSKAWMARGVVKAEEQVKKSIASAVLAYMATPTIATLLASAPVAVLLRWLGIFESIGNLIGRAVGYAVVAVGLLSAGVLVRFLRYGPFAAKSLAEAAQRVFAAASEVWRAPGRAERYVAPLHARFAEGFLSFGRPAPAITLFTKLRTALWAVTGVALVCLAITVTSAVAGISQGIRSACDVHPESTACRDSAPTPPFGPTTTFHFRFTTTTR